MFSTKTRGAVSLVVLIFIGYAIYTNPSGSADAVHAVWNVLVNAFNAILRFFDQLIKG